MRLNLVNEPHLRCYGWRIVLGLGMILDGIVYLVTLTLFNPSFTLKGARKLARSRLPQP